MFSQFMMHGQKNIKLWEINSSKTVYWNILHQFTDSQCIWNENSCLCPKSCNFCRPQCLIKCLYSLFR